MASDQPFYFNLKPSNASIVQGCPGVLKSFPRIEGILEVRSNNGLPVLIRRVKVSLINDQEISVPSSSGIGSNTVSRAFNLFTTAVFAGSDEILGLDIPFVVPITQNIIASGEIPKYSMINKCYLKFVVTYGNKNVAESFFEFPIPIKKYNTLPIYRQFMNPGKKVVDSPDRLVLIEYTMPRISVGPGDDIEINVKVSLPTMHNKKVKLKKLQLELKEIVEFHDGGFQDRVSKIAVTQQEFNGTRIVGEGVKFQLKLEFPTTSPWHEMTTVLETDDKIRTKSIKILGKIDPNVPLSQVQGFTVAGKFFSVRYELVLKLKFSHAKDMEIKQQIIVSPFDITASINILKWIMNECERTVDLFGPNFETALEAALKKAYHLSGNRLQIYKANSIDDWINLGLNERLVRTQGKVLDYYID